MKKAIPLLFLFFALAPIAAAETSIKIPLDFINEIAKSIEFKTGLNFIERLLVNQTVRNSSINGVKLKDFSVDNLIEYFNEDKIFKQISPTKLQEPLTGATLEFDSDGKCKKENCTITVDFNGDRGPNEIWSDPDDPKDRMIFKIKRTKDDGVEIVLPSFGV